MFCTHRIFFLFPLSHFHTFSVQVCCTAIVYATDRKNTKVEFPEARIYEETLNCLLYENRTGPDQDLMQVLDFSNPQVPITNIPNPRQPVQEALELLTLPTTRMSATDLAEREELWVDHLLDHQGLEVIVQALLGFGAIRTPDEGRL